MRDLRHLNKINAVFLAANVADGKHVVIADFEFFAVVFQIEHILHHFLKGVRILQLPQRKAAPICLP